MSKEKAWPSRGMIIEVLAVSLGEECAKEWSLKQQKAMLTCCACRKKDNVWCWWRRKGPSEHGQIPKILTVQHNVIGIIVKGHTTLIWRNLSKLYSWKKRRNTSITIHCKSASTWYKQTQSSCLVQEEPTVTAEKESPSMCTSSLPSITLLVSLSMEDPELLL